MTSQEIWVKPLIFVLTFLLMISLEPLYRVPLFNASLPIIKSLQAGATTASIKFFEFVSLVGGVLIVFGTLLVSYIWAERKRCFYYVFYFTIVMYITNVGKLVYHMPRPYMVDDDI